MAGFSTWRQAGCVSVEAFQGTFQKRISRHEDLSKIRQVQNGHEKLKVI